METNKEKIKSSKLYYNSFGVTVNITRDLRRKKSLENCPLKWCITSRRVRSYYSTGISLNESDWILFLNENPYLCQYFCRYFKKEIRYKFDL